MHRMLHISGYYIRIGAIYVSWLVSFCNLRENLLGIWIQHPDFFHFAIAKKIFYASRLVRCCIFKENLLCIGCYIRIVCMIFNNIITYYIQLPINMYHDLCNIDNQSKTFIEIYIMILAADTTKNFTWFWFLRTILEIGLFVSDNMQRLVGFGIFVCGNLDSSVDIFLLMFFIVQEIQIMCRFALFNKIGWPFKPSNLFICKHWERLF